MARYHQHPQSRMEPIGARCRRDAVGPSRPRPGRALTGAQCPTDHREQALAPCRRVIRPCTCSRRANSPSAATSTRKQGRRQRQHREPRPCRARIAQRRAIRATREGKTHQQPWWARPPSTASSNWPPGASQQRIPGRARWSNRPMRTGSGSRGRSGAIDRSLRASSAFWSASSAGRAPHYSCNPARRRRIRRPGRIHARGGRTASSWPASLELVDHAEHDRDIEQRQPGGRDQSPITVIAIGALKSASAPIFIAIGSMPTMATGHDDGRARCGRRRAWHRGPSVLAIATRAYSTSRIGILGDDAHQHQDPDGGGQRHRLTAGQQRLTRRPPTAARPPRWWSRVGKSWNSSNEHAVHQLPATIAMPNREQLFHAPRYTIVEAVDIGGQTAGTGRWPR